VGVGEGSFRFLPYPFFYINRIQCYGCCLFTPRLYSKFDSSVYIYTSVGRFFTCMKNLWFWFYIIELSWFRFHIVEQPLVPVPQRSEIGIQFWFRFLNK
jgi:hypothetical protein